MGRASLTRKLRSGRSRPWSGKRLLRRFLRFSRQPWETAVHQAASQNQKVVSMKTLALAALIIVSLCPYQAAQTASRTPANQPASSSQMARGKYIVEDVAVCGQCHTPRDSNGEPEANHQLEGGPVWFQPAAPMPNWPLKAPRIAGTPPASDPDMVRLLTTGIWTDGKQLRQPMPQFRMTSEDAQAVVAYLRSLTPNRP